MLSLWSDDLLLRGTRSGLLVARTGQHTSSDRA